MDAAVPPDAGTPAPQNGHHFPVIPVLGAVLLLCLAVGAVLGNGRASAAPQTEPTPAATQAAASDSEKALQASAAATPAVEPTPTAESAAQAEAKAAQKGSEFMAWLKTQDGFADFDDAVREGFPYLVAVNRAASTVTVYAADNAGAYTVPYLAMVCSGGDDTPLGHFETPVSYSWRLLSGPCYGQYATRIYSSYLFHSVPYYTQHKDDLEYDEYNKLGTPASLGCIRLAVADVKWIYDNCPIGTPVAIYDNADDPGPLGKPESIPIDPANETLRGWDPTDPDPANPWGTQYAAGTAIRSAAAQQEWDAAQADGRWTHNLTPTDLRGSSHDSATEGTRG
jgi:lipoprotein-anchoring transpeptidase ErfK/SrfK